MSDNQYDYKFNIALIGNSAVGKSSLLTRFIENKFLNYSKATDGIDFRVKTLKINQEIINLQIWDISGRGLFEMMDRHDYRGLHGVVIVFDITEEYSCVNVHTWMQHVSNFCSENVKKLVIGNKIDLVEQRVVTFDQAKEFAETYGVSYIECSAKEAVGVDEAFLILTESIRREQEILRRSFKNVSSNSLKINLRTEKDMKGFCLK